MQRIFAMIPMLALLAAVMFVSCEKEESEDDRLAMALYGEWESDYCLIWRYDFDGNLIWTGGGEAIPDTLIFNEYDVCFYPAAIQVDRFPYWVESGDLIINGSSLGRIEFDGALLLLVVEHEVENLDHRPLYFERVESYYKRTKKWK